MLEEMGDQGDREMFAFCPVRTAVGMPNVEDRSVLTLIRQKTTTNRLPPGYIGRDGTKNTQTVRMRLFRPNLDPLSVN
jgi:hypothetical protein